MIKNISKRLRNKLSASKSHVDIGYIQPDPNQLKHFAVCSIFKNEYEYVIEWIAFHQALGITNFIIADNESTDGTSELLASLDEQGIIKRVPFPTPADSSPQLPAYKHILQEHADDFEWMAFIDADELLVPEQGNSLHDIISKLDNDDNVSSLRVNWKVFGSNGHKHYSPDLVIERFTQRALQEHAVNKHFKTILKTAHFNDFRNPHQPDVNTGVAVSASGVEHTNEEVGKTKKTLWQGLALHHYVIKSEGEFQHKKRLRGGGNNTTPRQMSYYIYHDLNDELDNSALLYLEQTKLNIQRIKQSLEWKQNKNEHNKFFVHIPKTAGTSFRNALETRFGNDNIKFDYGADSQVTSDDIKACIYQNNDLFELHQRLVGSTYWLCGHSHLKKYAPIISVDNIFTYLRSPVERYISHFNHACRYQNYDGTLTDYIKQQKNANLQSRLLSQVPLSLIGFIGITEQYNDSLELLNENFNFQLEALESNVNDKKTLEAKQIEPDVIEAIKEANKKDIHHYNRAQHLLNAQLKHQAFGIPYVHHAIHHNAEKGFIRGAVYSVTSNEAIEVMIKLNDKPIKTLMANQPHQLGIPVKLPREGLIGFHWPIHDRCKSGDTLKVLVKKTGQELHRFILK